MIHRSEVKRLEAGPDNTNPRATFYYSTCTCGVNSPMMLTPPRAENFSIDHLRTAFEAGEKVDFTV